MLIAADRNPYAERAVLLGPDGRVISHFESSGRKGCETWLTATRRVYPDAPIVGSPLDEWPDSLRDDPQMCWLHPGLVKRLYSICRPWNLQRKLHRAQLFAYLHQTQTTAGNLLRAVQDFELQTAQRIVEQLS